MVAAYVLCHKCIFCSAQEEMFYMKAVPGIKGKSSLRGCDTLQHAAVILM